MTKSKYAGICLALVACLAGCAKPSQPAAAAEANTADAVAIVNGHAIGKAEFDSYVQLLEQQARRPIPEEQRAQALDQLINMRLLSDAAEKANLPKDPKISEQLDLVRLNVLSGAMVEKYLKDNPTKDEELRPVYDAQIATLPQEYHVRHILTTNKAAADAVIAQLKGGGDFQKLAATKSTDSSKTSGGDLGWLTVDAMDKSYSEAVLALKKGQYSEAPVQTKFGWHVFLVEDTRATQAPAFEDVKDRVKQYVDGKRAQTYIEGLRKSAKVENKLQPAAAPAAPAH